MLLGHQRPSLDIPGNTVDRAVGRENSGFARSKCQPDQSLAGNFEICFALWRDLYNPASAGKRCGDIDIAIDIQSQALRTSQSPIENGYAAVRVDLVNTIETGRAGAGNEHIAVGTEGQVISGNAWFKGGEDKNLPVTGDLEYGTAAIADI